MNSCAWARRAAASISSRVGLGPRVGDVLGDRVAENRKLSSATKAISERSEVEVDVAHVGAVDHHPPLARVVEARQQRDEARLARAVGPTSATVVPASIRSSTSWSAATSPP